MAKQEESSEFFSTGRQRDRKTTLSPRKISYWGGTKRNNALPVKLEEQDDVGGGTCIPEEQNKTIWGECVESKDRGKKELGKVTTL